MVGRDALLLVEGAGRFDEVTISGDKAEVNVLKEGLLGPTAVTLVGGMAYVTEARLNLRGDTSEGSRPVSRGRRALWRSGSTRSAPRRRVSGASAAPRAGSAAFRRNGSARERAAGLTRARRSSTSVDLMIANASSPRLNFNARTASEVMTAVSDWSPTRRRICARRPSTRTSSM